MMKLAVWVSLCIVLPVTERSVAEALQNASRAEQVRVALARQSLYAGVAEPRDRHLAALFTVSRKILSQRLQDGSLDSALQRTVLQTLLVGCSFEWSGNHGELPAELSKQRRLYISLSGGTLEHTAELLNKIITPDPIALDPAVRDLPRHLQTIRDAKFGPGVTLIECVEGMTRELGVTYAIRGATIVLVLPDDLPAGVAALRRLGRETVTLLGILGPRAAAAAPVLEALREHPDPQIAERARIALKQVRTN